MATLSVVFAFVFAPVGAVLGHLGLRQIRRTGQRGRDRALVGTVLSYAVIIVLVGVLVVWVARPDSTPVHNAAPSAPPPPATVAPSDVPGLMPSLNDVKSITGDQTLVLGGVLHKPQLGDETLDRAECRGALDVGVPDLYPSTALLGFYMPTYVSMGDAFNAISVAPGVGAFQDEAAAQKQLTKFLSVWRQCNGASVKDTQPNKEPFTLLVSGPIDVGTGISTVEMATENELNVHAIAAKANVVIDLLVSYTGNGVDRARRTAVDVANQILNKIPG
ncbi:sensor domain-containing protein [Mycobacterium sp. 852002-40037_SCH5390672]|uniref:sensor domain-containing protein n=1 Tax=Mycobacterium sp. 852002-40037_SCH5390672 TaxID=1834089 RepID=UPI0018D40BBF|nr:sensor domain-containing protein [Mycobacterium sp. 852002-40037_SCH5390672]